MCRSAPLTRSGSGSALQRETRCQSCLNLLFHQGSSELMNFLFLEVTAWKKAGTNRDSLTDAASATLLLSGESLRRIFPAVRAAR